MRLPQIPYPNYRSSVVKNKVQTVDFRGINLSAAAGEGEMSDSKGISTADYPWLTQRPQRAPISGYDEPTDIYEWDGHLVVVDGGVLYYDGAALCNVTSDVKQYAVVNTKLVVWPDKLIVDLTNRKVTRMDAGVTNNGNATLSATSIQLVPRTEYSETTQRYINNGWPEDERAPWAYVYDSASWDGSDWTLTGGAWVNLFTANVTGKIYIPTVHTAASTGEYVVDKLYAKFSANAPTDPAPAGNDLGFYGVLKDIRAWVDSGGRGTEIGITVYDANTENNTDLTTLFKAGDVVTVSGTTLGLADRSHATISSVTSDTVTFSDSVLIPTWTLEIEEDIDVPVAQGGHGYVGVKWQSGGTWYYISINDSAPYTLRAGNYLLYNSTDGEIYEWSPEQKKILQTHSAGTGYTGYAQYTATLFSATDTAHFTVSTDIPNLDYICAHENRLWGVSNRVTNKVWNTDTETWDTFTSRVIYASELGEPMRFWTFSGVDTDSYQVAVGSEDDFTAICSFGGGVCCWKENRLHKILGSYPSEYYMAEYQFAGVTDAASMAVINETLFYKGRAGIYAWNGGVPSLVSAQLGNGPYTDAVGGTDGSKYYVSMCDTDDRLFVYDRGLWVKDDDIRVDAMCFYDGSMHFLVDGEIYAGGTETVEWMAEFAPMTEGTLDRKGYTRINIRLDMYAGSSIKVETKQDRRAWETVWEQNADDSVTLNIPIRIGRCDRFQIRLSGVGKVTVQAMRRELIGGHER